MIEAELIQLIHDRYGLVIHVDQAGALSRTLADACREFHCTPEEYLQKLKVCPSSSPLVTYLIGGITVGETYFFRDRPQMDLLEKVLLPRLINRRRLEGNLSLRIWSTGCSTGEEIYTVAMMLHDLIKDLDRWDVQLLGTDINREALKKAAAGVYGKWSLRSIEDRYKAKYFLTRDKLFELTPAIREMVRFDYLNLMDNTYPSPLNGTGEQDIILCRNVLIYFDNEPVRQIINKLKGCLAPDGNFIFGASDPIAISENNLCFHHEQEAIYFSLPGKEVS